MERDVRVLADGKLNEPGSQKGHLSPEVHQARGSGGAGYVPFCLCCVASPLALGADLGATTQEDHKTIREHPKDSYKDGERSEGQDV